MEYTLIIIKENITKAFDQQMDQIGLNETNNTWKLVMFSFNSIYFPRAPVKTSATWKGWLKNRWILRARATINLSSSLSLSIPQNNNDILKILVVLKNLLDTTSSFIVIRIQNKWWKHTRCRIQGVNNRIDTKLKDLFNIMKIKLFSWW